MIKKFFKVLVSSMMAFMYVMPSVATTTFAKEDYLVVDDNVTSTTLQNYFIYSESEDDAGLTGWSNSDAKIGEGELKTQHWVWNENNTEASKHSYQFTFVGTGVELIGITPTGSSKNIYKLDEGESEEVTLETTGVAKEQVLYSVKNLAYGTHTITVLLPNDGSQKGLQVSYAKVYGSRAEIEETTTISHKKTSGTSNKFTFSDGHWLGDSDEHTWSTIPPKDNPKEVYYTVDFVGHAIDIYAGKNKPMGYVAYYVDDIFYGEYSLYNKENINSTLIKKSMD